FHETASFRLVCGDKHYIDWTVFFISFLPFIAYLFLANQQAYTKRNIFSRNRWILRKCCTFCNNHHRLTPLMEKIVAFRTTIRGHAEFPFRFVAQTATFEGERAVGRTVGACRLMASNVKSSPICCSFHW
ncbi:hypothetical protein, partial [Paenibacillus sp. GCM10027626]|uniref:hypothetical protein n=1 Tax=Paenibacillus sp. GCM10027626 TaxID=3273411 RepID=UPI003630D855